MDSDLIERIEDALQGSKKQIVCFWEFVEAQNLQPLRSESDMKRALFMFLVGEDDLFHFCTPGATA